MLAPRLERDPIGTSPALVIPESLYHVLKLLMFAEFRNMFSCRHYGWFPKHLSVASRMVWDLCYWQATYR